MRVDEIIPKDTLDKIVTRVMVGRDDDIGVLIAYTVRALRANKVDYPIIAQVRSALKAHGLALKGETT